MRVVETAEALCRGPEGRCVVGDGWIYFCRERRLWGFVLWGYFDEERLRRAMHVIDVDCNFACHRYLTAFFSKFGKIAAPKKHTASITAIVQIKCSASNIMG